MEKTGRPVHILSIGFEGKPAEEILSIVDREAAGRGTDIVLLPETCLGSEPLCIDDPLIGRFRALARKHGVYIALPFNRKTDIYARLNTALIIGRDGADVGTYDKIYPYWSEFDLKPACIPGKDAPVFDLDFGRVGMAICFDVNFPEVFRRLSDGGAELVLWLSAYSAGSSLLAHTINHNYVIATATYYPDCTVCDITGREVYYQKGADGLNVCRVTVDLDRAVYHENFNLEKRDKLLADFAGKIECDTVMPREQWFTLRAAAPGISARETAAAYGLEELTAYRRRSRVAIDKKRDEQAV